MELKKASREIALEHCCAMSNCIEQGFVKLSTFLILLTYFINCFNQMNNHNEIHV